MANHTELGCCLTKDLRQLLSLAWEHAMGCKRISSDVERARILDFNQITGEDFVRECAWAIYGAFFSYTTLDQKWCGLQKAYLHWDIPKMNAQHDLIIENASQIINRKDKAKAILTICGLVEQQGWADVKSRLEERLAYDQHGNPVETPELTKYLDELPFVGPVLASYIAKNMGVGAIKPDIFMTRLAKHLGYGCDKSGVDTMAGVFQKICGEKINVIDTVLWNWAKVPQTCLVSVEVCKGPTCICRS